MEQDTRGGGKAMKGHSPNEFQVLRNLYDRDGHSVSFRPDASCQLQLPHKDKLASLVAYLEVDRSTEGHLQWFERKLPGIEAFLGDKKALHEHWPNVNDPIISVFVLCKSQERLANLIETTKTSLAARFFRFTTFPLDAATVLTDDVWLDCDGEFKRIIR
jgi:hypothetical protein